VEYEYTKVIVSHQVLELFRYEKRPRGGRKARKSAHVGDSSVSHLSNDRQNPAQPEKSPKVRTEANARSARISFRRLVQANLARPGNPVLASFTYRENQGDIGRGRKDWNAFAKRAASRFGESFAYIVVPEYQKRGALHFHALLWGVPPGDVAGERHARLVATLWGKGFCDLTPTDGSPRLATYLSKYMTKTFLSPAFAGKKAYIASRNVLRPIVDRDTLLQPYFYGKHGVELSTAVVERFAEYVVPYLGRATYKKYNLATHEKHSRNAL